MLNNNKEIFCSSLLFLMMFFIILPIVHFVDFYHVMLFGEFFSFTVIHLILLLFCQTTTEKMWWSLTLLHGYAHIFYPAFNETIYNIEYTPLPDFVIHAIECLTVYMYHKTKLSGCISIILFLIVLCSAIYSHYHVEFMATKFWLFASGCGVIGAFYHMLMLNISKSKAIYCASIVIWFFPYLGYLDFSEIPEWDARMNDIGLFRIWFLNYFITYYFYDKIIL